MSNTPWIRKLQILYVATGGLWAIAFFFVVYAATQVGDWGGVGNMAIMGIGPAYFVFESFRLARLDDDIARNSSKRLFRFQRALGIWVTIGGVVGLLPAFANFLLVTELSPSDLMFSAGMLVPWALVYVYMVVFFIAEGIRRGLKLKKQPTAELAGTSAVSENPETDRKGFSEAPEPAQETPAEKTSIVEKPPIAPNLFFVTAILLAMFTGQLETTAFNLARSGELTDLQTPGLAFSFLQFIDIGAKAIAFVALVFGVINFLRDTTKLRRFATPLLALATVAIPPGTLGFSIANTIGLSPEAQANDETALISRDWINNAMESGHPDEFLQFTNVYDCAAENCDDPDSGYSLTRTSDVTNVAPEVCATVMQFAFDHGANSWAIAPDYATVALESATDPAATEACVASLGKFPDLIHPYSIDSEIFRLIGDGEIPFQMDLHAMDMGTRDENPDAFNYWLDVATTFVPDELLPGQDQLTAGTHELNDMLTVIGQARLANPDVDPNDADLISEAMDENYTHDNFYGFVLDPDGKIRFVEIVTSDDPNAMCVSLAPWDEEFEGMPDPGYGYGVSSADSIADLKANPHFAATAWGHCNE